MKNSGNLYNKTDLEALAAYLKTVRKFKGYTRKAAAENAAVSLAWLQKLELGTLESIPRKETLEKYCNFLGCSIKLEYSYSFTTKKGAVKND